MKEIHIKIIDKMKSLLFLYFCVAMAFSAMASSVSDTYVIPNPQQMVCGDGHFVLRTQASSFIFAFSGLTSLKVMSAFPFFL
jgi:hypothetical protein